VLAQSAGDDFGFDAGLAFQNFANRLDQFGLTHHFNERAPGLRQHIQAQDVREASIGEEQALRSIHDGHTFHHASENGGGKIAFFSQRSNGAVKPRGRLIERNCQSFQRIARAICFKRTKIAFRYPTRKHLQAFDAPRERPGDQQRSDAGHEKHDHGCQPKPTAEFPKRLVHRLQRQGKAQNHGRTASNG